jgi:hypothetical protein
LTGTSIAQLKALICKQYQIGGCKLLVKAKLLKDDTVTLDKYGIQSDTRISVVKTADEVKTAAVTPIASAAATADTKSPTATSTATGDVKSPAKNGIATVASAEDKKVRGMCARTRMPFG